MIYMLDTNICSYIIRNTPERIKVKLKEVEREHELALSSVVVSELFYGAYKKNSERLINLIKGFIENFTIYNFDKKAAEIYGKIRAELERKGRKRIPHIRGSGNISRVPTGSCFDVCFRILHRRNFP